MQRHHNYDVERVSTLARCASKPSANAQRRRPQWRVEEARKGWQEQPPSRDGESTKRKRKDAVVPRTPQCCTYLSVQPNISPGIHAVVDCRHPKSGSPSCFNHALAAFTAIPLCEANVRRWATAESACHNSAPSYSLSAGTGISGCCLHRPVHNSSAKCTVECRYVHCRV